MLKSFDYKFNAGPFFTEKELGENWKEGNCRRAVQLYFHDNFKLFLKPDQILCPNAYYKTGNFVFKKGDIVNFSKLLPGDVIYAEKIRDKNGVSVNKKREVFKDEDDYITALHTAVYSGFSEKEIWHSTSIEMKSCYWSLQKFLHHYLPIVIKRIIIS